MNVRCLGDGKAKRRWVMKKFYAGNDLYLCVCVCIHGYVCTYVDSPLSATENVSLPRYVY